MKLTSKILFIAMLVLAISSCKKDDENLPFNELDQEANKQLVENSAVNAAKAFDELKDQRAIEASVSIGGLFDMASPLDSKNGKKSKITLTIDALAGLHSDENGIHEIFAALESPGEFTEDPETLEEVWDEVVGTYTWNPGAEDWDYTANADAIVFKFPSSENGMSNNATLTISDYTGVTISNPLDEEYEGDLPASLNMDFDVDGTTVLIYTFAAEYNSDGIPSSIASDLNIESFIFSVDITNNDEEVSASYEFTQDGDIIIEISGSVEGDFTQENDEWEELDIDEVVYSGSFKFQILDISIGGVGDIKGLGDELDVIYPEDYYNDPTYDQEASVALEAIAMNKFLKIYAIDEDSRKKIADVEAYVVMENENGYVDYWIDFRLVFGDGSLVDLETYFDEGFEELVSEINSMIDDLNSKYDWGLEHMDY